MDFLNVTFSASSVTTSVLIPPLFAFVLSFFCSMGGVSGAVLILPFQVSFLKFTSPSVNSTNLLYNVVGIPGGVYRYIKEGKMVWPLTWIIIIGTIPGVFIGY
ncbi:MAG: sulfite exporter TauE/SafE family protein, partial [Candidatus Magnetominusculus sp. LBB02]|nr:sulfite exporter TauE/SafE family protein [Candidatus Magnetominusculus sp. LBB02]